MCENCELKEQIARLESRLGKVEERILFAPSVVEQPVYGANGWDQK